MKTSPRQLLIVIVAAGVTFIIGYMMGWTRAPMPREPRAQSHESVASVSHSQTPVQPATDVSRVGVSSEAKRTPTPAAKTSLGAPQVAKSISATAGGSADRTSSPTSGKGSRAASQLGRPAPAVLPSEPVPAASTATTTASESSGVPAPQTTATQAPPASEARPLASRPAEEVAEPTATGAPRIEFEHPDHDFGSVMVGDAVEHEFVFRNVGDATLCIEKVRTSCGCTAALATEKEVAPGHEGRIKATFRTAGYRGKTSKSVYVETNDPDQPRVMLRLSGEIKAEIEVSPRTIYARDMAPGETLTRIVTVRGVEGHVFQINKVSASRPEIHASEPRRVANDQYEIEVTVKPESADKALSGSVNIETDSQRQPKLTVRIFANVRKET